MACLVLAMVVATHKVDGMIFWLNNICDMCECNLEQIVVNEATKMIPVLAPWSWHQSVQPFEHHDCAPTLEGMVIHQGHKGDSSRKVSCVAA
jgi:hypothetical protein